MSEKKPPLFINEAPKQIWNKQNDTGKPENENAPEVSNEVSIV